MGLLIGRTPSDTPKKTSERSMLLIILLLIASAEVGSHCVCPKASRCSSALRSSLHCCCKNLRPSVRGQVTSHKRCYSCQPTTMNWLAWSRLAGSNREGSGSSCPWGAPHWCLHTSPVAQGSVHCELEGPAIRFSWITCHQI